MGRYKNRNANAGDPLRWRITNWNGRLRVVQLDMAPPLIAGETPVWEGAARHLLEAYRKARDSGLPIRATTQGFKLRRPVNGG